jgi:hypothetical protein
MTRFIWLGVGVRDCFLYAMAMGFTHPLTEVSKSKEKKK